MKYYIFASGSKGNSTLLIINNIKILIDVGITKKKLKEKLENINLKIEDIDFILLTHEHGDHIHCIKRLQGIPVFSSKETYSSKDSFYLIPYRCFDFNGIKITPISISHDANNPFGYIFQYKNEKLSYVTDTGFICDDNLNIMKNSKYIIIESNHDTNMLENGKYPYNLKVRIGSNKGHLSNLAASNYLINVIGKDTKEIVLAHLSQENNTPEIAYKTVYENLKKNNIDIKQIKILIADQERTIEGGENENQINCCR